MTLIFRFVRRDVADSFVQEKMVEPVDPFERGIFDSFELAPQSLPVDHLNLAKAIARLSQSVVVAVIEAASRRLDPDFCEALGVLDGHVLRPAVVMMDEAASMGRPSIVERLT